MSDASPKPTVRQALLIVFLLAPPLAIHVADLTHGVYGRALETAEPTADSILDGTFARRLDAFLGTDSWAMRELRPHWTETLLDAFLETPPRIAAGRDGWLFLTPSMRPLLEPDATREWHVHHTIIEFMDRNFARGDTHLMVLVMPAKWRLYPERVRGPAVSADRQALYARIRHELSTRGIDAPDVLGELRAERARRPDVLLYPPTDTHLSVAGFRFVTEQLVPRLTGVDPELMRAGLDAVPIDRDYVHHGDLLRLMNVRPESATGRRWAFPEPRLEPPATADRPGSDILIFGDSFFRQYDGLFQRLIGAASGLTVDARYSGWAHVDHQRMVAEYRLNRPKFILIALTERRFAAG